MTKYLMKQHPLNLNESTSFVLFCALFILSVLFCINFVCIYWFILCWIELPILAICFSNESLLNRILNLLAINVVLKLYFSSTICEQFRYSCLYGIMTITQVKTLIFNSKKKTFFFERPFELVEAWSYHWKIINVVFLFVWHSLLQC